MSNALPTCFTDNVFIAFKERERHGRKDTIIYYSKNITFSTDSWFFGMHYIFSTENGGVFSWPAFSDLLY